MKVTRNKVTSKISTMSVIQSSPFNLQASKIITIKQLGVRLSDYSFSFLFTSNRQVTSGLRWSKNVAGMTGVLSSVAVVQIVNNQLSFFDEILRTWHKLSAFESPFDGRTRISSNCTIKSRFPSFIPCLFYRWQHYLWCRYWFSRSSRWSWQAFWPRFSLDSFFPSRSRRTRRSCFSGFSRWSHGTLRALLSFQSPPATWSLRPSGTRESGGSCRTDLFTWLTVLEWRKLFKVSHDFSSHVMYCDAN